MKTKQGSVIFLLMFFAEQVTARHTARVHASELLEHLNISPNNHASNPLVVLVKSNTQDERLKTNFDDVTGYERFSDSEGLFYEEEAREQAKQLFYNYLLRTGDSSNTQEDERKTALRAALRARCKKVVECTKKCEKEKPDKYCPKTCKAVFDELDLCDPPKKKNSCEDSSDECKDYEKEKYSGCDSVASDECNTKKGRTMPPKWRL